MTRRAAATSGVKVIRPRRRRFHQQLSIALIAHPVHETGHRVVGSFVGGDAGVGKELPRRFRGMLAEPGGDHVAPAQCARLCRMRPQRSPRGLSPRAAPAQSGS